MTMPPMPEEHDLPPMPGEQVDTQLERSDKPVALGDLQVMAQAFYESRLFKCSSPAQAMSMMLLALAEGLHPATAMRDYQIVGGKPSKTSEAMHRDFIRAGGRITWHDMTDQRASATFKCDDAEITITWDIARAKQAGLVGKDNWRNYPRQMLRARVISEGVRATYPLASAGLYTPEEISEDQFMTLTDAERRSSAQLQPSPTDDVGDGVSIEVF